MSKNALISKTIMWLALLLPVLGAIINCTPKPVISSIEPVKTDQRDSNKFPSLDTTPNQNSNNRENSNNSEIAQVDLSKIPTITYCELATNAADFDGKIVRLRAVYFTGFEKTYLYDSNCEKNAAAEAPENVPAEMWAEWDKSLVTRGDSDEAKLNLRLNGFGRKDVTVIGRFNSTNAQGDGNAPNLFGHLNCCRCQFLIMKLEKLHSVQSDSGSRIGEPINSPLGSPSEAYKTAFIARQKKDIEGLKRVLSKKLIKFLAETGAIESKTLDDQLKELTERPQARKALTRDEKIYGDEATLEYLDENGKWIPMSFVKENGEWKLTLPGEQVE